MKERINFNEKIFKNKNQSKQKNLNEKNYVENSNNIGFNNLNIEDIVELKS